MVILALTSIDVMSPLMFGVMSWVSLSRMSFWFPWHLPLPVGPALLEWLAWLSFCIESIWIRDTYLC